MKKKIFVFSDNSSAGDAAVREALGAMAEGLGLTVEDNDDVPAGLNGSCNGSDGLCSAVDGDCARCPYAAEQTAADEAAADEAVADALYSAIDDEEMAGWLPTEDGGLTEEEGEALARAYENLSGPVDDYAEADEDELTPADYDAMIAHATQVDDLETQAEAYLATHPETPQTAG